MLKAGDRLWNGVIVTAGLAEAYNSTWERINSFKHEGREAPEYLLNGAHNLIAGPNFEKGQT